jgi:hypothetical protein
MSRRTLQCRSGLIRLMRLPVRQHHFGEATPDPSEIGDQPMLAKFGVGGPRPRKMTTGEQVAVIHCYPTQMEVIQRAPAAAAG